MTNNVMLARLRRGANDPVRSAEFFAWLLDLKPQSTREGFLFICGNGELLIHAGAVTPVAIDLRGEGSDFRGHDPDGVAVAMTNEPLMSGDTDVFLDHVSMNCAYLDRSVAFYQQLGFVLTWSGRPPNYEHAAHGFHEELPSGVDWVHVSGQDGYLALMQADWKNYGTHNANSGPPRFIHIGLAVRDVETIARRLEAAGRPVLRAYDDPVGLRIYLNDPDGDERLGTNVELVQYHPGVCRSGRPPY